MKNYTQMTAQERRQELIDLQKQFDGFKALNLKLNMARGKPGEEQLNLAMPMLDTLNSQSECNASNGADCRNYGELTGIPEAKRLFGEYMGVAEDEIIVAGSSSLSIMFGALARAMLTGVMGSENPWCTDKVKFICPVPGYDRHFSICRFLGIEMLSVPMTPSGPDMDQVEALVKDASVKGMWCVPKFSNPQGITYSDETVRRLAALKPAAKDFRVFCDNAYAVHYVYRDTPLLNVLQAFKDAGNPHMVYLFGSTSKVTMAGAGVSFFAASKENIAFAEKQLFIETIGWDKMNMLRHVRFLRDMDGIRAVMDKHAQILRGRFDIVLSALERELAARGVGDFIRPEGGYFVTYRAPAGCAKRIVALCKEAGVVLTGAGATHPLGVDPDDSYIRIAPTYPGADELKSAMEVFCVAARLAALEETN